MKIILLLILFHSLSLASEYVVIANKDMKRLSKIEIKAIFLKKITIIDDKKVVPINLGIRDSLRKKFEKKILRKSFRRLKTYWTKQHYLGHRPPISMHSQQSIKSFVKKVEGAIGYIELKNLDDSVKEIYRWRD